MPRQEHTTECRRRLEDAMMTDTSTATRVKATRVRQAERIVRDLDVSGATSGSSGPSGYGQHKRVRLSDQERVDTRPEPDAEMQTGSKEAPVMGKTSTETDAERLEKEVTSAEADSDRRFALKRLRWRTP